MTRYAQLVVGPAGSGKSTYCSAIVKHCEALHRTVHVVNLDPAAEYFDYPIHTDVRDLIQLEDVMEDDALKFGPNGGLVFCMEYLTQNMDWLQEQLDEDEDDYILFDCPGQIELYTHIPVMKIIVESLQNWNFRVAGIFILDSQFMIEPSKFVSGVLCALSTMVNLEIPHLNVMTKLDLLGKQSKKEMEKFLEPDLGGLLSNEIGYGVLSSKFSRLNEQLAQMIDDYSLVKFLPLDNSEESSIADVLMQIDNSIQYGEDLEPREPKDFADEEFHDEQTIDFFENR